MCVCACDCVCVHVCVCVCVCGVHNNGQLIVISFVYHSEPRFTTTHMYFEFIHDYTGGLHKKHY